MCVCACLCVCVMYCIYCIYLHVGAVPWSVHPTLQDAPVEADEELSEEERRALEEPLHLGNGNEEIGNDELPVPVRDPDDISEEGSDPGDPGDVDEDEIRYGDDEESVRSSANLDDLSYRDPPKYS